VTSFNPERAEVPLALPGGPTLKLVMDYQAVAALMAKFGDQWDTEISAAMDGYKFDVAFAVLEILASKNHPDLSADEIKGYAPGWLSVVSAINMANNVFLFGSSGPPAPDPGPEHEEGDGEEGEERPFANGRDGEKSSARLWQRLMQRVYGHRSSGP
jgi:hypothetical protein